jgi:hypothetical protein
MDKPTQPEIAAAVDTLKRAMQTDPELAWSWHCNLAVPIRDATGISHSAANEAGAHLMHHLFDCDITTHPNYEGEKGGAQRYAELRIAAEEAEDAEAA